MRKILLFVWACMGLVCLMSACKTSVKSKEWKLVWVEDFDQKNSFDESVWTKIPRGTSDWNNYMSYYDSCYAMQDGNLILRGIANHTQKNDTAPYLTGGVYTKGKKLFTGGRVEVCARLQAAKGAWPAIWMLPEKAEWPKGGEIDIMERLNHDHIAYQTTHSYYTHIYPDSLVFAVNHRHTYTYPRIDTDKEGQFPFYQPYYLLIDMQLGGSWVGAVDPKELPVEMWVDWVKYYEKR